MPETTAPESKPEVPVPSAARRGGTSENIQVFIRIRPLIERETSQERCAGSHSIRATDHQTIEVRTPESTIKCAYDAVFDHTFSQEQVYDRVRECTQSFLQGFNSTLFAYGQTGSGKSFTMFGAETDLSRYRPGLQNSQAGIIPRAIKEIFAATVQMEADAQATVFCSFVQIYNEQIFDLLRDTQMNAPLEIHEDRQNGIFVEGLSEYAVRGVSDCLQLLQCGEQNRAVRSTHMNQREIDPAYVEKLQEELEQLREVVRLLRLPNSANGDDGDEYGGDNNENHEEDGDQASAGLKARVLRLVHENTELKHQNEKQQKELEKLRLQQSPCASSMVSSAAVDPQILQHLENTVRQLKEASDRFFRFEIEEEELKVIHSRLFQGFQGGPSNPPLSASCSPLSTGGRTFGGGNVMKPRPPLKLRSFSSFTSPGPVAPKPVAPMDLTYRVRGRSSSIDANGNGECWKNDIQAAPVMTVEKELEMSRKAIEKQTKLQNWLIEKERREILKLQQEQQFIDEQRRNAAEKDAKFFKRAAATKKKLLVATAAPVSEALDFSSSKPATAET
ncbi:hypothetical protein PF007_g60 [Phytophthora fragariae]|uniref:Kinesin motor domain-containing protein n=1 Tax=Phytophthora fragariae TaxID=53985 RepID=A0A6A3TRR5_9STRA|nr:hypothetical protein PF011_g115 [Phytophthora fragariae]KAE9141696.1 hypothetical protein PF007_g60 [Phytophthora fragariae]